MPTNSAALLAADHLTVRRAGTALLEDVSLAINSADFITIIGPNGAGKSLLLKCLAGIVAPNAGDVVRAPNTRMGYVPQRFFVEPSLPLTVERFLRLHQPHRPRLWQATLADTDIEGLLNTPLQGLSYGELQRVLLARALLGEPNLLMLDEPAQNLDMGGQLAFYERLDKIYARGNIAILMVSHDVHWVMASTREVVCLYRRVCCRGAPKRIAESPEFAKLFGAHMAASMAYYVHDHSDGDGHSDDHGAQHAHEYKHKHEHANRAHTLGKDTA